MIIISFFIAVLLPGKLWFSESNWFDNTTTHYFFSAIFQGFAALLGILFVALIFNLEQSNIISVNPEDLSKLDSLNRSHEDIVSENTMKTNIQCDFLFLITVIIISIIALALGNWYIQNILFWNIFSVCFTSFLSIRTIIGISKTLIQSFFL